jgi:formylglycine-generating enzyme required for sulfatase activity
LIKFLYILSIAFLLPACDANRHLEMVEIPEGEFTLGFDSNSELIPFMSDKTAGLNAQPRQTLYLESFYIDRYETTYEDFIKYKPLAKYSTRIS